MNDPPEGVAVRPALPQRRTATDPRQPAPKTHRNSSDRRPLAPLLKLYPTIRCAEAPFSGGARKKTPPGPVCIGWAKFAILPSLGWEKLSRVASPPERSILPQWSKRLHAH